MKTQPSPLVRLRPRLLACLVPVFVLSSLAAATHALGSERWATLEAIHQLENPRNVDNPGSQGELGPYQFLESTWKIYTAAPFSRALDRRSSDAVAVKHYNWIKSELERRGVAATPYRVALAWNGGLRAVFIEHPSAVAVDYATRAANLAQAFEKTELADAR